MSDLLKEAIADARAVRETALANAKMALEEAFTPQLQSMLSAKLAEEDDEEEVHVEPEVEAMHDDETDDEGMHKEGSYMEDDEIPGEEEVPMEPEMEGSYMEDDEIPGDEEVPVEEMEPEEEDELDLEAIVRQLESEINEEDDAYPDNVEGDKDSDHIEDMSEGEHGDEEEEKDVEESFEVELDEEEDLKEEDDAYPDNVEGDKDSDHIEDMAEQLAKTQSELDEYKAAVTFLKDKIHEVNILNAKLLFTNKLFKEYALDNGQKLRVVETFDRAQTTREIKLVYSTLAENFGDSKPVRKTKITESASRKTGSTKPSKEARKVISEEAQVADRFRKLAGLNKSN
jgi:hypothetical protein|tara:strand:- start:981 stop:2009 length:1029 start_codon:yes stop_codon:yes gene_type:complete